MVNKMRMWMVDPKAMCVRHLMGEHLELHMFAGTLNKGKSSVRGYIDNNLLEPKSIVSRHKELTEEMTIRKYNHMSPLKEVDLKQISEADASHIIDREKALQDLLARCPECRERRYV